MSDNPTQEILSDLFRHLETLETQNIALVQVLKDKKVVTEKKFASYLEEAAVASDVKWRAARARMEHLFTQAPEPESKKSTQSAEATKGPEKESAEESPKKTAKPEANEGKKLEQAEEKKAETPSEVSQKKEATPPLPEAKGQDGPTPGPKPDATEPAKKEATQIQGNSEKEEPVEPKKAAKPQDSKSATEQSEKQPQASSDEQKQPQFVAKPDQPGATTPKQEKDTAA